MIADMVARTLAPYPPLHEALVTCVQSLSVPGRGVAVLGSVARGIVDRFSDIDLAVWAGPDEDAGHLADTAATVAAGIGRTLVSFRGCHLGRPNLVITYAELGGAVIKTDIEVLPAGQPHGAEYLLVLFGHPPLPAASGPAHGPHALADALNKAAGWTWLTYAKIVRGEFFAAARAIDFTREHALLPALLFRCNLPQDGHRHLEARLPADAIARLHRTHPAALSRDELMRAFHELTDYVCAVASQLDDEVGGGPVRVALRRINDLIAADCGQRETTANHEGDGVPGCSAQE